MGEPFGYLQVMTIVATLLRHFKITPKCELPQPSYHAMVVGPEHEKCIVRLERRKVPLGQEVA
jgi:sterol 14-demethylase